MNGQDSRTRNLVFLSGHIYAVNNVTNVFWPIEQVHDRIWKLQIRIDAWPITSEQIFRMLQPNIQIVVALLKLIWINKCFDLVFHKTPS
jgi:hypothetical protein